MNPPLDWEAHRTVITKLYGGERYSLDNLIKYMATNFGLIASPKQFKDRIRKWKLTRNFNKHDVVALLQAFAEIKGEEDRYIIRLRGRKITKTEIRRYLKKAKLTPEALLTMPNIIPTPQCDITRDFVLSPVDARPRTLSDLSHGTSTMTSPSWTNCLTPATMSEPSRLHTPQSSGSNDTSYGPFNFTQLDFAGTPLQHRWSGDMSISDPNESDEGPRDAAEEFEDEDAYDDEMGEALRAVAFSPQFNAEVARYLAPEHGLGRASAGPSLQRLMSVTPPEISQPTILGQIGWEACADTSPSSLNLEILSVNHEALPSDRRGVHLVSQGDNSGQSRLFLSHCFNACILRGQGHPTLATISINEAMEDLEQMIKTGNVFCLTTLNLLVSVLEAHGQKDLCKEILDSTHTTASRNLGSNHPISATIGLLSQIVSRRIRWSNEYDLTRLNQIHSELEKMWGPDSPSTLTALYHVAWRLILEGVSYYERAKKILSELKQKCEQTLGPYSVQTITTMTTLSRVLYHLKQPEHAESMMRAAIERIEHVWESYHPYRLEARSRQAMFLRKIGALSEVEHILQEVVQERYAVLGPQNPQSQKSLQTLRDFLRDQGREAEANELPEKLSRMNLSETYAEYIPMQY